MKPFLKIFGMLGIVVLVLALFSYLVREGTHFVFPPAANVPPNLISGLKLEKLQPGEKCYSDLYSLHIKEDGRAYLRSTGIIYRDVPKDTSYISVWRSNNGEYHVVVYGVDKVEVSRPAIPPLIPIANITINPVKTEKAKELQQ